MNYFYKNAVNVFTDASTARLNFNGKEVNTICPAFVTTIGGGIVEYGSTIFSNTTNSYGEIYALLLGIQSLIKYKNTDLFLNVYSDSEISVKGLTKWIKKWFYCGRRESILRAKSGMPVANQEVFLEIMREVIDANVHINVINVLGHTDSDNVNDMIKFVRYFYKENDIPMHSLPTEYLQEMAKFNDLVDEMSRNALYKVIKEESPLKHSKLNMAPIYWFPKEDDYKKYRSLVNQ